MKEKEMSVTLSKSNAKRRQEIKKNTALRKRKRKKRKYTLYYILLFIIITITSLTLSMTVFFNIKNFSVKTVDGVMDDEIIKASGVEIGENLIRLNLSKVEKSIVNKIESLDEAKAIRSFPNTLSIECIKAIPKYSIKQDDGTFTIISQKGRILSRDDESAKEDTTILTDVDVKDRQIGEFIDINGASSNTLSQLKSAIDNSGLKDVTSIEIKGSNSAEILYQNRIKIQIDDLDDTKYILDSSVKILNEYIGAYERGTIFYQKSNSSMHFLPEKN